MKKILRKLTSFLMAFFMVIQVMLPAFMTKSKAQEENPNTIKAIDKLEEDKDSSLSVSKSHEIYDKKQSKKDEDKFSVAVSLPDTTSKFRLVKRNDLKLYEDTYYKTNEEASKEYWRIKDMLNKQGLDLDLDIIEDENGYKLTTRAENVEEDKEKSPYGENYSYIDFKIMDDFDFNEKGNQKLFKEEKLVFNIEFLKYESPDPNFNLYEKDQEGNLTIKNEGDILALIRDKKKTLYTTNSLKEDFKNIKTLKEEKEKKEAEQKAKKEAEEKAKKEEEERAKKEQAEKKAQEEKEKKEAEKNAQAEKAKKEAEQKEKSDQEKSDKKEASNPSSNKKEKKEKKDSSNKESKTEISLESEESSKEEKASNKEEKDSNKEEKPKDQAKKQEENKTQEKIAEKKEEKTDKKSEEKQGLMPKLRMLFLGQPEPVQVKSESSNNGLNLDGKKFHILTRFETSNRNGPIKKGQFFNIHLDDELTVKNPRELKSIYNGSKEIASPSYDSSKNIIKYEIINDITEDLKIPLNIPVDYDSSKVKLDDDGTFTVINKVSGLGLINPPKDLLPQKVDSNGNPVGSVIEPGRDDVTEIIEPDDQNYKVSMDVSANPDIKDGELQGYNWTVRVSSDTDLSELGLKTNFTVVKGSGLGDIESKNPQIKLEDQLPGAFGIHDSKHHAPGNGVKEITYNLYTKVMGKQEKYMLDLSVILTKKNNKVGAKRIVIEEGWPHNKVKEATPTRVGINNRTTIIGQYDKENSVTWTVTDGVSTGDEKVKLPLETRKLEGDQSLTSSNMAVYGLDDEGRMVEKKKKTDLYNKIPKQATNPDDVQAVGNIAVYEYKTNAVQNDKKPLSLGGVAISKYEDINVEQNWNLGQGLTMPGQTLKAVEANNEKNELGETKVEKSNEVNPDPAKRNITIPDVKVWNIDSKGNPSKNDIKIKQDFPTDDKDSNGKAISYYENNNWYDFNKKGYFIHNRATVEKVPQYANFTLIKKGDDGKPLEGATFKLLGQGEAEVTTNKEGKIFFQNIAPGDYKLIETKAPRGYKLNQETTLVNVDENGGISISGSSAKLKVGANPTVTISHNVYPGYMNAMHYARVNDDGSVTTYIYLKANSGTTNKDTRLSLRLNGSQNGRFNKTEDVKVYDVNPYYRESLKTTMIQQRVDQNTINSIGNINVLTTPNNKPIRANRYTRDPFTGQSGYRITFPEERFVNDWGFLVVANSPAGTSVTYDWLTDGNKDFTQNNARLQDQTVTPTTAEQAIQDTEITISNEKFQTRPVEIKKLDKKENPIVGANFELKDADGNVISTATSQAADEKGENAGLASFGKQPEGKYTIEETSAPEGYIKSKVIFDVTVDESNQVTYKPRFKSGNGTPINGEDYLIEDEEQTQQSSDANVTKVSQTLKINESDEGDIGIRPQVWEAYRLESLIYNATIDLENTAPGQRFSIQFDRNLDFTQYFGEFPKVKVGGVEVADPYFDYTTNKLTYVYNEKSAGGKGQAKIELKGIIPSKYFAQNDGTYPFTVIVAPGKTGIEGQRIDIKVPADYGQYDYDTTGVRAPQSYYFRDVYKGEDGSWYVAVLAYYNPDHRKKVDETELKFNWLSTNYQGANKNFFTWTGNGNKPAYSLRDVKVYRTSPNMFTMNAGNFTKRINRNMPLSFGVRPEQEPAKYNLIYSKAIDPNRAVNNDRQGGITLNYDPSKIQDFGPITKNSPLRIGMPAISDASKNGYIIEQTFKIDDMNKFNNLWRVFLMQNNSFKSSFITRANYNKAIGDQAGGEIPKFFSQKVALFNKKYTPGKFKIKKLNEADLTKTLPGASFRLEDENKNAIFRESGQDGIVRFNNLKPGIYTLTEESAPDKYIKSDKTWRVNVGTDGQVTIIEIGLGSTGETLVGDDIELQVTNKPVATKFTVYKKDNENIPLQGAKFKITTREGKEVATGTSDKNGVVTFNKDLEKGTYLLEEEAAPAGFKKLDKKWVIEIDNNKAKVYNYIKGPESGTDPKVNKSILGVEGTKWVNVSKRPTDGWNLGDNRQSGYYNNYPIPFKLGTRIVGKNTKDPNNKYVIQRYVINPEADTITLNNASIHREKPWFTNMDWYAGNEPYKIFELDKAVDGNVEDIRLENYKLTDITNQVGKENKVISGGNRLYLDFNNREITKPIVIDVKIPYTSEDGGVGTGMDLQTNKGLFWKSDYYRRADRIVEGDPVVTKGEGGNIKGAYISEGSLDVNNEKIVQEFSFKKVDDGGDQTDGITGATFSLKGPKKSDQDPGKEVWKKSGKDGTVKFDNLTPGIYHLTESGAPQGYEKSNTDWTVTVTNDGKIYIKDNNPGSTVPDQGAKWQKVKVSSNAKKEGNSGVQGTPVANRLDTRITEVNKKENKFRQVFIINKQTEALRNAYFEIHAQPPNRPINKQNTKIVSLVKVGSGSTPDSLNSPIEAVEEYDIEELDGKDGQKRIRITPKGIPDRANQTLALTIESTLGNSGSIGTGIDFVNFDGYNRYWMAESYEDFSKIELEEGTDRSANKNTRTVVGNTDVSGRQTVMYPSASPKPVLYSNSGLMERSLGINKLESETTLSRTKAPMRFRSRSINTFADGLEIGDELVGEPVQSTGWQAIDPNRSEKPDTKAHPNDPTRVHTKITEINKDTKQFKQIFLINGNDNKNNDFNLNIHRQPNGSLSKDDVSVRVFTAGQGSTVDNIINPGKDLKLQGVVSEDLLNPGQQKIRFNGSGNPRFTKNNLFVIEVVSSYTPGTNLGLGMDYYYNRSGAPSTWPKYWGAQSYSSDAAINKEKEPKQPTKHKIDTQTPSNGTFTVDKTEAAKGEVVTITPSPAPGYKAGEIYVGSKNGQVPVNNNKFTMPDADVTIRVEFEQVSQPQPSKHNINIIKTEGGTVTADKSTAGEGEEVKLTIKPDSGYEIEALLLLDKNDGQVQGSSINHLYKTFKMPDEDVWVKILFKKSQSAKSFIVGKENDGGRGGVVVDQTDAKVGEKVTFTLNPYRGYKATNATVKKNNGVFLSDTEVHFDPDTNKGYFIMPDISPATAVTVRGVFKEANDRTVHDEKTETIKHDTKVTVDESLAPGERVTDKKGKDGSAVIRYTITFEKIQRNGPKDDEADPVDWPADILQALKAKRIPGERIAAFTKKEVSRIDPVTEEVRVGKSDNPVDTWTPTDEDRLIKDGETQEIVKITNKKAGIIPKILKRSPGGDKLEGATFTLHKMTDKTYSKVDTSFGELTATSDENGDVIFKNGAGNVVKLQKGYYVLRETKAPTGFKKSTADWKIEVKDDGGRMYAEYQGPESSPSSFINDNKKSNAGYSADNAGIKYKSRLTYIDTESKTYIQRIYIDTRAYSGNAPLNLQITPKYKREEIDTPGKPPKTIKDGVKTAYFTAYKLSKPEDFNNMNDPELDKIIRTYDLANDNMSMIKTARWRPFDWGFDEDQLNLDKGVYIVDVEGFYDDVIITGESDKADKYDIPQKDLGKIDLHVDFYSGERQFKQLKLDKNGNATYEAFPGASYQGGASQVAEYVKSQEGADAAKDWSEKKDPGAKYANFVGKEVTYNGKTYKTGKIDPPLGSPAVHADTSVDLNPLYNSKGHQEIPREGLEFINEEETFNITFSKHGRKDSKDDVNSKEVTKNRLEGAVFRLEVRGPGGQYEPMPGTTVASAFNGYFGFRGLKPGRYRLMEVKAPEGYKPIKDPVLHFTIAYEKGKISEETGEITKGRGVVTLEYNEGNGIFEYAPDNKDITPESGRLVDYVTSATAKNMGKIINEVPGKGKVELTKYDDNKQILPGAEFKLTRISRHITDEDPDKNDGVYTKTVGDDGKIVFDELPIGQYELEETKAPKGYQNKGKKWRFTVGGVGLDPYINDSDVGDRDISKSIEMNSEMSVLRPDGNDGTESEKNSKIHPHKGHALSFKNTFKIKDDTAIKAGDYFTIKLSDNIDLEGVMREKSQNLDLFADGVGTIAKAKYDKEAGTLTYVFTSYADQYNKTDFENTITAHINLMKVPNPTTNLPVGMGIGTPTTNNIDVVYELDMAKESEGGNTPNMTSKIVSFDRETGEFVQYFYINRDKTFTNSAEFEYTPSEAVTNLKFDYYALRQNSGSIYDYNKGQYVDPIVKDMPESFGVNEYSNNLNWYYSDGYYNLGAGQTQKISLGTLGESNSLILKVTGKVKAENIASYDTYAKMYGYYEKTWTDYYGYHRQTYMGPFVERTNGVRIFENKATASAKLEIDAINPKNEIIFKKVDQEGKILPGAKFKLEKYYKDQDKWIQVTGSEKTAEKDGLVKYEKLEPGKYALIETEAPEGYGKIEGHIVEFTVGEDGVITRQVAKEKAVEKPQSLIGSIGAMLSSVGDANTETVTEPVSVEPIDVVNYKEIEFEKVDANDHSKKLKDAVFEVHYKEDEKGNYQALKVKKTVEGKEQEVTMTATSDDKGKFKLPISKDGYYALVETKAPDGYTKATGLIREFKLENGKVQTYEKDPIKASHKTSSKGKISSEIISVDMKNKTFKQRIIINPNHKKMTIPSYQSYIRIKENDWKITPKYKDALKKDNGIGGLVNVALLKKDGDKTLTDLEEKDYKKVDAISFTTAGNITGSRYGLKEMLGITTTDDKQIITTDTIVMEFTGKLDENNDTGTADQLFELVFDSGIDDSINDKLDVKTIAEGKPAYADHDSNKPIQVENKKTQLPMTNGLAAWIGFTIIGLVLMVLAVWYYNRKKNKAVDISSK